VLRQRLPAIAAEAEVEIAAAIRAVTIHPMELTITIHPITYTTTLPLLGLVVETQRSHRLLKPQ